MVAMLMEIEEEEELLAYTHDDEIAIPVEIHKQIAKAHNAITGHDRVKQTVNKMQRQGCKFSHMREYVDKLIKQCPVCQELDNRTFPIGVTPFTSATYRAMQRLQVDVIGPLLPTEEG